mgnify:CR=1 FL=1
MTPFSFVLNTLFRYIPESFGIAVVLLIFGQRNGLQVIDVISIISVIMLTLFLLDMYAPLVAQSTRHGMGFGIGYNLSMQGGGKSSQSLQKGGMDDKDAIHYYANDRLPPTMPYCPTEYTKRQQRQQTRDSSCSDDTNSCGDIEEFYTQKIRQEPVNDVRPYETESTL